MTFQEYRTNSAALLARVEALLGNAECAARDVLAGWLREGLARYRRDDRHGACACAAHVQFVLQDMDQLREEAPAAFSALRTQLRRAGRREDYFGVRQEIRTATSLSLKRIQFQKTERPDFILSTDHGSLGVESTSCQLSGELSRNKDIVYKIESALNKKAQKIYAIYPVLLEIDITNILFHAGQAEAQTVLLAKERHSLLRPLVDASPFESVLLFTYGTTFTTSNEGALNATLTSVYSRVDRTAGLMPTAANFLETHFPMGRHHSLAMVFRSV
jgi:hypothetical protein